MPISKSEDICNALDPKARLEYLEEEKLYLQGQASRLMGKATKLEVGIRDLIRWLRETGYLSLLLMDGKACTSELQEIIKIYDKEGRRKLLKERMRKMFNDDELEQIKAMFAEEEEEI